MSCYENHMMMSFLLKRISSCTSLLFCFAGGEGGLVGGRKSSRWCYSHFLHLDVWQSWHYISLHLLILPIKSWHYISLHLLILPIKSWRYIWVCNTYGCAIPILCKQSGVKMINLCVNMYNKKAAFAPCNILLISTPKLVCHPIVVIILLSDW